MQSGCRLSNTGQVIAARSRMERSSSEYWMGPWTSSVIFISLMRLGLAAITFSTSHSILPNGIFRFCAEIPMTVHMQEASAAATRSVGEKRSPLPPLSNGASVSIVEPELI